MFVLGCDRAFLYAHPERQLTLEENAGYDEALEQRARGVPSQYIVGHQEFWGMDFIVTPAVLIPRPETEHVIETVLPLVQGLGKPKIADVGTGSGCIAIVLASELPQAEIHATEISPKPSKSPAPMPLGTSLNTGSISTTLTCCKDSNPETLILSFPTLPTWANLKRTRFSSKCASLSRVARYSRGLVDWK